MLNNYNVYLNVQKIFIKNLKFVIHNIWVVQIIYLATWKIIIIIVYINVKNINSMF